MVKGKLFSRTDRSSEWVCMESIEHAFRSILQIKDKEGEPTPPCRDEESLKILQAGGITFLGDDWYSVMDNGKRSHLFDIKNSVKCALCLVHYSRQGIYFSLRGRVFYGGFEEKTQVFEALHTLPFDILVGIQEHVEWFQRLPYLMEGAVIENYSYGGKKIEVNIAKVLRSGSQMSQVKEYLFQGTDGKYYVEQIALDWLLAYDWTEELDEVVTFCEDAGCLKEHRAYLVQGVQEPVLPLEEECAEECKNCPNRREPEEEPKRIRRCHYMMFPGNEMESECKYPAQLTVVRRRNGTYLIRSENTVKYPYFDEMEWCATRDWDAQLDEERFVLVVDVDSRLSQREDLQNAMYGFRVTEEYLDVYSREEAVGEFGKLLREAYESGRYTIENR